MYGAVTYGQITYGGAESEPVLVGDELFLLPPLLVNEVQVYEPRIAGKVVPLAEDIRIMRVNRPET